MMYGWLFQRWYRLLDYVPDDYLHEACAIIPEIELSLRRGLPDRPRKYDNLMLGYLFAEYLVSHKNIVEASAESAVKFVQKKRNRYYKMLGIGLQTQIDEIVGILIWKEIIQRESNND